jgi:two-component sensor histidine kinase
VELDLAVADVSLAVGKAIPCGLIVNALITNALKHAFPGGRSGRVRVELAYADEAVDPPRLIKLTVRDDGVGIPGDPDIRQARTLGLELVATLVEQIDGRLQVIRDGGTSFEITFAKEE